MNQASEYGKKSNFGPDFEPFGPNVDPKYFFRGFYFFEMLDIVASYRRIQFQETFFFLSGFSSKALSIHRTAGERGGLSFIPLHHFHPFTNIETFSTLHVRWPSRIFNRNACVYQTATRWDLPPYQITIQVIDWWCNVCLLDQLILGFVTAFDIGNRWIWTHIDDYHPCITSEPTNQVS